MQLKKPTNSTEADEISKKIEEKLIKQLSEQTSESNRYVSNSLKICIIELKQNKYLQLISKLENLSPLLTIKRGYSMTKKDGKVITKTKELNKKDKIEITLTDGTINAEVI